MALPEEAITVTADTAREGKRKAGTAVPKFPRAKGQESQNRILKAHGEAITYPAVDPEVRGISIRVQVKNVTK